MPWQECAAGTGQTPEVETVVTRADGDGDDGFLDLEGAGWVVESISGPQFQVLRVVTIAVYGLAVELRTLGSSNGTGDVSARERCSSRPRPRQDQLQSHSLRATPFDVRSPRSSSVLLPGFFRTRHIAPTDCKESILFLKDCVGCVTKLGNEHI